MSEIIIDGVNVAECEYAANTIPVDCENNTCFCYEDENCYFKQLKRLEQELDIKEKMLDKFMIDSGKTLEKLQKENKKLKEVINEAKIEYENLLINRNDFAERAEKYRQTLEEIREKAQKHIKAEQICFADEIINLINEVLK